MSTERGKLLPRIMSGTDGGFALIVAFFRLAGGRCLAADFEAGALRLRELFVAGLEFDDLVDLVASEDFAESRVDLRLPALALVFALLK